MDYQKDNRFRRSGDAANSQGQQRDHHQGQQQKTQQQSGASFVVRKAEKLTTALYMVTDIMSDKEPMKWKARETGVELLSDIAVSSASPTSERMSALRNVMKKIERIVSFLDIAQSTRMITEMNASVLKREYVALKDAIEAEWKRVYDDSKSIFNESFFEVGNTPDRTLGSGRNEAVEVSTPVIENQGQSKLQVSSASTPTPTLSQGHQQVTETVKETPKPVTQNPITPRMSFTPNQSGNSDLRNALRSLAPVVNAAPKSTPEITPRVTSLPQVAPRIMTSMQMPRATVSESGIIERTRPDVGRDDRRKIILALIKQKPSLTVKDIAKSIPAVSEKTIQRELLAMVAESILIKRGERRWSTYSLRAA
jgi:hypothetical protein